MSLIQSVQNFHGTDIIVQSYFISSVPSAMQCDAMVFCEVIQKESKVQERDGLNSQTGGLSDKDSRDNYTDGRGTVTE